MLSRFSQRCTVVTSRLMYAAISFHESRRSSEGRSAADESGAGESVIVRPPPTSRRWVGNAIVAPALRRGNRRHSAACPRIAADAAACGLPPSYGLATVREQFRIGANSKGGRDATKAAVGTGARHYHRGRNRLRREGPGDASSQRGDAVERTHPT